MHGKLWCKMIQVTKTPIFTQEIFSFTLPNFETYKKQIQQIVLVEDNKSIHKIDTSPEFLGAYAVLLHHSTDSLCPCRATQRAATIPTKKPKSYG